jgi:A/G-specific adenine glycosylase
MLQQTRVETVIPYYERFVRELPDVQTLAEAPEGRVLALWSGLGYYRRARMLHAAARRAVTEFGAKVPSEVQELRRLEGVGRYTAGAVASIAFGRRAALVDGNVARVLARLFAIEEDVGSAAGSARVWQVAGQLVEHVEGEPGDWNQALMELGATVCTPREPRCVSCPVRSLCAADERGLVSELPRVAPKGPPREVRRVALVLASASHVLLARRRRESLFGGLWEPPCADGGRASLRALAARVGVGVAPLRDAGEVVHVLSHRRMLIDVVRGPLGRRRRWALPGPDYDAVEPVRIDELPTRAHSTLARKVLSAAGAIDAATVAKPARQGLRSHSK